MNVSIVLGPDPLLSIKSTDFDIAGYGLENVQILADNMMKIMLNHDGIGLAAPQVGINKRLFLMHIPQESENVCVINPTLLYKSTKYNEYVEGCLSFPGQYVKVTRPSVIIANFIDYNGKMVEREFSGLSATCFQHEYDHIDGVTMIDHIEIASTRKRWYAKASKIRKMILEQSGS